MLAMFNSGNFGNFSILSWGSLQRMPCCKRVVNWLICGADKLYLSQLALKDGFPSGSEEPIGRAPGPISAN